MEQTTNFNLKKPVPEDFYNIQDFNANMDILDEELKAAQDKADQAFQQASNGKEAIKAAITGIDPTVTIPTDATFQQLATAIGQIETGIDTEDATAIAEGLLENLTAYVKGLKIIGTMPNKDGHTLNARDVINLPASDKVGLQFPDITGDYNLYAVSPDTEIEVSYGLLSDKLGIKAADIREGSKILNRIGTFSSDATAGASATLNGYTGYQNGVKYTGNIPIVPADYNGQLPATEITVGVHTGDGLNYAYMKHSLSGKYSNGVDWVRSAQPDLIPSNILSGKTIMGVVGNIPVKGSEVYTGWRQMEVSYPPPGTGRIHFRIPLGAYLTGAPEQGGLLGLYMDDGDYKSENILSGKSIFGLVGTAIAGKRFAAGQVMSGAYTSWYVPEQIGPYPGRKVMISDLNLSFTPTLVLLIYAGTGTGAGSYSTIYFRPGFYTSGFGVYTCRSDQVVSSINYPLRPASGDINEIITVNFQNPALFNFWAWE